MEAVALTLDLLGKVDGLLAHPAFLASSPVWHSEKEDKNQNEGHTWGDENRLPVAGRPPRG